MDKEKFIKKWDTELLKRIGLTEALSQQLDAEFRKDLDAVIGHENEKIKQEAWPNGFVVSLKKR